MAVQFSVTFSPGVQDPEEATQAPVVHEQEEGLHCTSREPHSPFDVVHDSAYCSPAEHSGHWFISLEVVQPQPSERQVRVSV